jgi:hypothetical protein
MRLGRQLSAPRIEGGAAAVHRRYRDRINDEIFEHPFRDYWDIFVLKHRNPANVALHGLGVLIFYGSLAAALLAQSPWWLLGVPVSQASGLLGHVLFERSYVDARDVVFSWRASRALNRLFASVLRGRYRAEIERVEAALRAHASEAPAGGRSEARSEAKPSVGGGPEAATSAEAR